MCHVFTLNLMYITKKVYAVYNIIYEKIYILDNPYHRKSTKN